jgi:hypothetical protein
MSQTSKVLAAVAMTPVAGAPSGAKPVVCPARDHAWSTAMHASTGRDGAIVMIGSCAPA